MAPHYECRLTIVGRAKMVAAFERTTKWRVRLKARHIELYQNSRGRMVWWFDTSSLPIKALDTISKEQPNVTVVLVFEEEDQHQFGIVKAIAGQVEQCVFAY